MNDTAAMSKTARTTSAQAAGGAPQSLARRTIDRAILVANYGPKVLRRRAVFKACKAVYWKRYKPEPATAAIAGIVADLQRDGVVVLDGWMKREPLAAIVAEVRPDLDLLADTGKLDGKPTFYRPDEGVVRIMDVGRQYPSTLAFYDDPTIKAIARAYVSQDVTSYLRMAEVRREVGAIGTADAPHMDDWRMRFKAFLLLDDVPDAGHAPFVYYKGSHVGGRWRGDSEYIYFRDGQFGRYGHFFLHEWEQVVKTQGLEKLVCTGAAGTLILTDTRGVHHGTPVKTGPRYLLGNYFNVRADGQA